MALAANSVEGKAKPFLERIESINGDLESEKAAYMNKAKALREDIKTVVDEAKEEGVPKKALKGLVKYRQLERQQSKIGSGMDIADQGTFESLVAALGQLDGTPLGDAAKDAA
jgi:uncharacterized protein (UPF0335 family)